MKLPSKSRPILSKEGALLKLSSIGQEHLLKNWDILSKESQERLLRQIHHLDEKFFLTQKNKIQIGQIPPNPTPLSPFKPFFPSGNLEDKERGLDLLKQGKVALVILAGGQGSRLRYKGAKGLFPVTPFQKKSLFQFLTEKVAAASRLAKRPLEMAIMTSPLNHVETQTFFTEHSFFGLNASQVTFFYQRMWPFLDFNGDLFLQEIDQIAQGPNGNGSVFHRLFETGLLQKWKERGIEMIHVIPVDNPLADPFQSEFLGFHSRMKGDISMISSLKRDPEEKVGVLATQNGKGVVVEYTELSEEEKNRKDEQGNLLFGIANLGILLFSMPFVERMAQEKLPLHIAKKVVQHLDADGQSRLPEAPNAFKFEEFIFDVFPFADQIFALLFPREKSFAPLKNLKGEDSIESVHAALFAFDREMLEEIIGRRAPYDAKYELAPQFHYPTAELLKEWKGKPFPNEGYIHE